MTPGRKSILTNDITAYLGCSQQQEGQEDFVYLQISSCSQKLGLQLTRYPLNNTAPTSEDEQ